ncbi:MAG: hydrogenase iron-sulfur subunit [Thermoplasmatales archaeon]|nr:hydrogenase iron-sulfur subunit [Thermoplasmatales archaeon]
MAKFEPKLLGFLCNWCAYAGADLAGVSRYQYPPNMRVIRVMCSGRVDPLLVLKAFKQGIDGVAVLGCHPGDCHYQTGNYEAENKMKMTKQVLEKIGIEPERLYLDWVSAAEGKRFSEVISDFTERMRKIGPIKQNKDYKQKISFGESIVESVRIRWLVGKERKLLEFGNVYNEKIDEDEFKDLILKNIAAEYDKHRIFSLIKEEPQTVSKIADELSIPKSDVSRYLTNMENTGLVALVDFEGNSPRYIMTVQSEET